MASIFLVNDNKIVSRLLQLSSEKHGYLLEEKMEADPAKDYYDFVLIDSDTYTPEIIDTLKSKISFGKLGYIGVKKEQVPPEFDVHLDKPFLPSDFVSMIDENIKHVQVKAAETAPDEKTVLSEEVNLEDETLSLDINEEPSAEEELATTQENIDTEAEEELEALKELEDLEEPEDLPLGDLGTSDETESTEIPEDGALKDIEKTEDALKELDALDEEIEDLEDLDLSLDSGAVMSTGIAEQYIEEPATQEINLGEKPTDEISNVAVGAALSAAAVAGAAMLHKDKNTKEEPAQVNEEESLELDALEGSESLEHESDYLEEELSTKELANEFDTLNEEEVMKALGNEENEDRSVHPETAEIKTGTTTPHEAIPVVEEVLHEEIASEGEETLVESNDVEQWIRDAVAKAITPEMIKEALDGMEINVTLNFNKKES